jgi:Las1-like
MTFALIRFVNSLLDPLQRRDKSLSLSKLAANAGLPTVFVEVRHWGTHESNLPGAEILRDMGIRALEWLWHNYWNRKEGATDVIALWKSNATDADTILSALEKNRDECYEKLLVEFASEEDFSASRAAWEPLLSLLSDKVAQFPESFIEYIVETLIATPECKKFRVSSSNCRSASNRETGCHS